MNYKESTIMAKMTGCMNYLKRLLSSGCTLDGNMHSNVLLTVPYWFQLTIDSTHSSGLGQKTLITSIPNDKGRDYLNTTDTLGGLHTILSPEKQSS
jgi:hypothetical protein